MIYVLSLAIVAMSGIMLLMGRKISQARIAEARALREQEKAEDTTTELAGELERSNKHKEAQILGLMEDIEALEDDLENCTTPGARRSRLRSLVSKAKAAKDDHG